jgi:vacuolar-type H+-ATPase subunit E/Vma4
VLGDQSADGARPCLEVDPRDEPLLGCILSDLGLEVVVTANLTCWGGVVARSGGSRIVATNTLEARLERAAPFLRRDLAAFFDRAPAEDGAASGPRPVEAALKVPSCHG